MNNGKKYCIIKINIVNDDPYYQIKTNKNNINKINLTFYVGRVHIVSDLLFLVSRLKNTFRCNKYYNIVFDFKNSPKKIKDVKEFQQSLKEIFQINLSHANMINSESIHTLSNVIINHLLKCGKHPDFLDYKNPISFIKIKNYINNVLNKCYGDEVIIQIIFNINANLNL